MRFSKEIEEEIIDLFCNTRIKMSYILKRVAPNNEITLEELYNFISQYRTEDGNRLDRPGKSGKNYIDEDKNKRFKDYSDETREEIYELREEGKSYKEIANILNEKGIKISRSTVVKISDMLYEDKKKIDKRKQIFKPELEEEIYELKKKGMSNKKIIKYFNEKGIDINVSEISYRFRKMCKAKGDEQYKYLSVYKKDVDNETILALRTQGMTYHEISNYYLDKGIKVSYETIRQRLKKMKARNDNGKVYNVSKVKDKNELITAMLKVAKKKKATQKQLKIFADEVSKIYKEKIELDFQKQDDEIERE